MSHQPQQATVCIRHIQEIVARRSGLTVADLSGPCREQRLIRARQGAVYLARELTGRSLPDIADRFGGRDHSTIIASIGAVRERFGTEPFIGAILDQLRAEIRSTPDWRRRFKMEMDACAAIADGARGLLAMFYNPIPLRRDE